MGPLRRILDSRLRGDSLLASNHDAMPSWVEPACMGPYHTQLDGGEN